VSRGSDEFEGSGYGFDDVFFMAIIDHGGVAGRTSHPLDNEIGDSSNE